MNTATIENLPQQEWEKIIHNANKAGAFTCQHLGAMESLKELRTFLLN